MCLLKETTQESSEKKHNQQKTPPKDGKELAERTLRPNELSWRSSCVKPSSRRHAPLPLPPPSLGCAVRWLPTLPGVGAGGKWWRESHFKRSGFLCVRIKCHISKVRVFFVWCVFFCFQIWLGNDFERFWVSRFHHFPQIKWCFDSTFPNKNSQLFFRTLGRKQKTWRLQKMRKRRHIVWGYMIFLHLWGLAFRNIAWGRSRL